MATIGGISTIQKGPPFGGPSLSLSAGLAAGEVLSDHQGHLEDDGVVELPQIQAGELLDLLQTIDQSIAVDKELSGGLGDIQVVLKELVDGEQSLLIQGVDGVLLEDLGQEDNMR